MSVQGCITTCVILERGRERFTQAFGDGGAGCFAARVCYSSASDGKRRSGAACKTPFVVGGLDQAPRGARAN